MTERHGVSGDAAERQQGRATVAGELALSMMAISQPYSAWVIFLGMNFLLSYLGKVRK